VFKAHRLFYHSTLGLKVIKKKKKYFSFMSEANQLLVRTLTVFKARRLLHHSTLGLRRIKKKKKKKKRTLTANPKTQVLSLALVFQPAAVKP